MSDVFLTKSYGPIHPNSKAALRSGREYPLGSSTSAARAEAHHPQAVDLARDLPELNHPPEVPREYAKRNGHTALKLTDRGNTRSVAGGRRRLESCIAPALPGPPLREQ
jgi:hypothetical protein